MKCAKMTREESGQKIIIFDSPDGTGKTNIATGLSYKIGIPYFRMGSQHDNWRKNRFKDALEFDQTYLVEFLKQTKHSAIIDRAYPSEWVYSRVYRRETNEQLLKKIDEEHARLGTEIIIPLRHSYVNSRKDEVVDETHLPLLHKTYLEFVKWTRCSTIVIYVDAFENNLHDELDAIVPELREPGHSIMIGWNIVLDKQREKKNVSDLFKTQTDIERTLDFKAGQ